MCQDLTADGRIAMDVHSGFGKFEVHVRKRSGPAPIVGQMLHLKHGRLRPDQEVRQHRFGLALAGAISPESDPGTPRCIEIQIHPSEAAQVRFNPLTGATAGSQF